MYDDIFISSFFEAITNCLIFFSSVLLFTLKYEHSCFVISLNELSVADKTE